MCAENTELNQLLKMLEAGEISPGTFSRLATASILRDCGASEAECEEFEERMKLEREEEL
jgi:hypothetical protein